MKVRQNEVRGIFSESDLKKIMGIVVGAILFNWALQNLPILFAFGRNIINTLTPLLLGLSMAFILNVPMRAMESKLPAYAKTPLRRPVSLLLAIALVFAAVLMALYIVIPEIVQTIDLLLVRLPGFIDRATEWGRQLPVKHPNLGVWVARMDLDWGSIERTALNFFQSGIAFIMSSILGIAATVFTGIFNLFLGFVFAVYILFQKENLTRQANKVLYAFLAEARADRIISLWALTNKTFSKFLTGQCTEAAILGLMVFVFMRLFNFPFAMVIAVLVTCTALLPIFGAFIAGLVGAFLILVTSPLQAFWFVVLFLVLQQIEGNLIYPRLVGKSVGLPALWVLAAVVIGGNLMGIAGMLVSVPLFSVLYELLRQSVSQRRR